MHLLDVCFPLQLQLAVTLGNSLFNSERSVHTAEMLSEEILAVKLISLTFGGALWARRAAVICEAEMLRGNVTLPLVLGAEGAGAARE